MRYHKVPIKGARPAPAGAPCEALRTHQGCDPKGEPCDREADGLIQVGGVWRAACWTHGQAARNPHRARPLQWQLKMSTTLALVNAG